MIHKKQTFFHPEIATGYVHLQIKPKGSIDSN